jgi:hypothetical protein
MASGENRVFVIWCWVITVLLWLSIANTIYSVVTKKADDIMPTNAYYYTGIVAVMYFLTESFSSTCCFLLHPTSGGSIYDYMQQMFYTPAHINMHVQCYHFTNQANIHMDAQGNTKVSNQQDRVNTHSADEKFYYVSWRDISGKFVLDTSGAMSNQEKAFVKLHLKIDLQFATDGTAQDFERQKESFKWRNNRDQHQDYSEQRTIDGFKEFNLVRVSDFNPKYFGLGWYILFMFLTVVEFYKRYVDKYCIAQDFTVTKVLSSKGDLSRPEIIVQYQQQIPCIIYMGNVRTYDAPLIMPQITLPSYEIQMNVGGGLATGGMQVTGNLGGMQVSSNLGGMQVSSNMGGMQVSAQMPNMQVNMSPNISMEVNANMPGITMTATTPLLHA